MTYLARRHSPHIAAYAPLNVLKPVAPNIWVVDGPAIQMKLAGMECPFTSRMTVVRSGGGELLLHSPIEPLPELEAVFFYRPSDTLILTDLIENFEPQRLRRRFHRLLVRLGGVADPDGKSPIDMRMTFLLHRRALRAAVDQMLMWAPERIILAHGRWYETNCLEELFRAFRWVLYTR